MMKAYKVLSFQSKCPHPEQKRMWRLGWKKNKELKADMEIRTDSEKNSHSRELLVMTIPIKKSRLLWGHNTYSGVVMQWMLYSVSSTAPPSPYIRQTLDCRFRKQGQSPCIEPFPSLVLNHAVHNRSRQWAILNYSGTKKVAAFEGTALCWLYSANQTNENSKTQRQLFMQTSQSIYLCTVLNMSVMHLCTSIGN